MVDLKNAPMCQSATSLQSQSNIFAYMRQKYVLMHQLAMNTPYMYFYIYMQTLKQANTRSLYI